MIIDPVQPLTEDRRAATSLADLAYRQIKDRLIMLDIRPGEPINDVALAAELGVGRTPVREAVKRLETDHLVVSYPRRGTFATVVDVTELGAISDIRQLLEPHAARRAAESSGLTVEPTNLQQLIVAMSLQSHAERASLRLAPTTDLEEVS